MTIALILGVAEDVQRQNRAGNLLNDIIAENFLKLEEDTNCQEQDTNRTPNSVDQKRFSDGEYITKL